MTKKEKAHLKALLLNAEIQADQAARSLDADDIPALRQAITIMLDRTARAYGLTIHTDD